MTEQEVSATPTRGYRWLFWLFALATYGLDQWTKWLVIQRLAVGESWRPWAGTPLLDLFALTHIKNSGAAFGFFESGGLLFIVVAIVVSLGILWYWPRLPRHQWWLYIALGLQLGGALGNLTDRLRLGWVTDFVHIGSFAIFNVADAAVVTSVVVLGAHMTWEDRKKEQARKAMPASEPFDPPLTYSEPGES